MGGNGQAARDCKPARSEIRPLSDVWWHAAGNVILVLIEIYNWFARYSEGTAAIVPKGFILSLMAVCILLFTGWKGWQMVYGHRAGIAEEPSNYVTSTQALARDRAG